MIICALLKEGAQNGKSTTSVVVDLRSKVELNYYFSTCLPGHYFGGSLLRGGGGGGGGNP